MISRRSVLKTIGAALLCPTIKLRSTVPDERLMLPFCDKEYSRYKLDTTFGIGSLTYATDARAAIRAELPSRYETGLQKLPPIEAVWKSHWHPDNKWQPLEPIDVKPTFAFTDWNHCPTCGGKSTISLGENYPDRSEMETLLLYGYDVDENCIRDKSCPTCRGLEYYGPSVVQIAGVYHDAFTMRRVMALPNPLICRSRSGSGIVLFKADGFEGITMGCDLRHCEFIEVAQ